MDIPRKVQLTGRNTYIVSLPHEWVGRWKIAKGSPVYLNENKDGTLTLSLKESKKELWTCTIDVSSGAAEAAMRNIVSAYVAGAGTIVLKGRGVSTIAEEARRVLSGVEITDESGDTLTLRILTFDDINMDGIIKRAFNVTQSMFNLAISAYRDGTDVSVEISRKEDDVDRLYLLLLRNLCIEGYTSKDSIFKSIATKSIEKVSDHLEDICTYGKQVAPNELIAGLLERSKEVYSSAHEALSTNELDRGAFAQAKKAYLADFEKVDGTLKKEKNTSRMLVLRSIAERCNKVLRYSEDILESANDISFAKMQD